MRNRPNEKTIFIPYYLVHLFENGVLSEDEFHAKVKKAKRKPGRVELKVVR